MDKLKAPKNLSIVPRGDWHYTQPETGMSFTHSHWKTLQNRIATYREQNPSLALDLDGGWQQRLWNDICEQNPHVPYKFVDGTRLSMTWEIARRFIVSVYNMIQSGMKLVDQEEADRRAVICTTGANGLPCPHNKHLSGCWGCRGVAKWIAQVNGHKKTPHDSELASCEVCGGCLLRSKVWVPLEALDNSGLDYPKYCWQHPSQKEKESDEDKTHQ